MPKQSKRRRATTQPSSTSSVPSLLTPWAEVAVALVVLVCSLAFFFVWRFGYQGDHAMCGLMAKSILTRGERPLFLWTLGYNGILVEAYAVAAAFWLFGVHMYSYYLFTLLCFFALCALYVRHVKSVYGRTTGLLACLLFAVSSPDMYRYIMRPQPNYTEIIVLALLFFAQLRVLVRDLYVDEQPFARRHVLLCATLGLTLGFSWYTYGIIVFFLGAAAIWLFALYLRDALFIRGPHISPRDAQKPRSSWLVPCFVTTGFFLLLACAQILLGAVGPQEMQWSASFLKMAAAVTAVGVVGDLLQRRLQVVKRFSLPFVLMATTAVVGVSPTLYFKYVLHGFSRNRMQLSFDQSHVYRAFSLFTEAHWQFLNGHGSALKNIIGCITLMLLLRFLWSTGAALIAFVRHDVDKKAILAVSPLAFLPFVILPLFCLNQAAVALESAKWTTGLWLFYALAQAEVLSGWLKQGGTKARFALCVLAILLLNNGHALAEALTSQEATEFTGEKLIPQLRRRGITRAYAEYWYAYSVNLYTNEEIIIEPVFNNYCPHYAREVASAQRIAFIDPVVENIRHVPDNVMINQTPYRKTDAWFDKDVGFLVLEKVN